MAGLTEDDTFYKLSRMPFHEAVYYLQKEINNLNILDTNVFTFADKLKIVVKNIHWQFEDFFIVDTKLKYLVMWNTEAMEVLNL